MPTKTQPRGALGPCRFSQSRSIDRARRDPLIVSVGFTKNVQDAPPLAVGRNERSWGWARCPRQDAVESVLGVQVLKAPPLAAG